MRNRRTQPSTRPLRWMIGAVVVVFIGLGVTTTTNSGDSRPVPAPQGSRDHETLQIDADMTQQMSTPNADTARQNHLRDPQLARSQDPGYLAALEQHQRDVDRMLARSDNP
jgi:hypothetical protein